MIFVKVKVTELLGQVVGGHMVIVIVFCNLVLDLLDVLCDHHLFLGKTDGAGLYAIRIASKKRTVNDSHFWVEEILVSHASLQSPSDLDFLICACYQSDRYH